MSRALLLGGLSAGLLLLAGVLDTGRDSTRAPGTPLAELTRNVQWIRFQRALLRGANEQAIRHAESAVRLDPACTESWELLASHLAVYRGSPEREHDLERRRAWFAAGIEAARAGERVARDPGRLILWRGMLYLDRARLDPQLDPGGARALLEEALLAFGQEQDSSKADALAEYAREQLQALASTQ